MSFDLRRLLTRYLPIPAPEIRCEYLTSGKPQLAPDQNSRAPQFNGSHATHVALIAVGGELQLGIDIENI
jgi:phosphopantetheinyl transferase